MSPRNTREDFLLMSRVDDDFSADRTVCLFVFFVARERKAQKQEETSDDKLNHPIRAGF